MTIESSQNKRSPCEKVMHIMRNILKVSSFPLSSTDHVASSGSHPPPHKHSTPIKQAKNQTSKQQKSRHFDRQDGREKSSFIKIQGSDHKDIGIDDDVNNYNGMLTSEVKASITNLKVSDYIKRFHERNQHESVSLVMPPPPPPPQPPPHLRQGGYHLK